MPEILRSIIYLIIRIYAAGAVLVFVTNFLISYSYFKDRSNARLR